MVERNENSSARNTGEASKSSLTKILKERKNILFINREIRALGVRTVINLVLVDPGLRKN